VNPKVSILILTYNRVALSSQFIPALVANIGNIDAEVLIWDNGSSDGSYDWVYQYGQAHPLVSEVVGSETNIGMEAINRLAERSTGEYIIKVDDDIEVPISFAERLVSAYERVAEDKLMLMSWDMPWPRGPKSGGSTFATRSGKNMYKGTRGKSVNINPLESVLITYYPKQWLINGVCRLSPRKKFLEMGGHPEGIIYGVDYQVSKRAERQGWWGGYFTSPDLIIHHGLHDTAEYRAMKNAELNRVGSPLHV